eukprot:m.34823 g.34823  ORF g.34823 m.34823 type:complete len:366 (+) comp32025_c0_seq1:453-1550(+)
MAAGGNETNTYEEPEESEEESRAGPSAVRRKHAENQSDKSNRSRSRSIRRRKDAERSDRSRSRSRSRDRHESEGLSSSQQSSSRNGNTSRSPEETHVQKVSLPAEVDKETAKEIGLPAISHNVNSSATPVIHEVCVYVVATLLALLTDVQAKIIGLITKIIGGQVKLYVITVDASFIPAIKRQIPKIKVDCPERGEIVITEPSVVEFVFPKGNQEVVSRNREKLLTLFACILNMEEECIALQVYSGCCIIRATIPGDALIRLLVAINDDPGSLDFLDRLVGPFLVQVGNLPHFSPSRYKTYSERSQVTVSASKEKVPDDRKSGNLQGAKEGKRVSGKAKASESLAQSIGEHRIEVEDHSIGTRFP